MNFTRSVRRPRAARTDDIEAFTAGLGREAVKRRTALRFLASLHQRYAGRCEDPETAKTFERFMRSMGHTAGDA